MLSFKDMTAAVDEPKRARMEQRTKPHVKDQIQLAAALLGVDETTFVTSVAYERARQTIADHEATALTNADRDAFLSALDAADEPTEALKAAAKEYEARVANAG